MCRIFAVFIALFVLGKAPGGVYSSRSHRSVAVHNVEQNISNSVIGIFFKLKLGIDLYGSDYLKVNFYRITNKDLTA